MTLQHIVEDLDIWEDWRDDYKLFVPQFIHEAKNKVSWEDWDRNVFYEFFERSNGHCVSSLRLGYFTGEEKLKIKHNWQNISPLLKRIAEQQDAPQYETYQELKAIIRNYTQVDRKAATNRMIASLQPNLLCTIVNEQRAIDLISLLRSNLGDISLRVHDDWFKNSYEIFNFYKLSIPHTNAIDLVTLPWQTYESLNDESNRTNDMSDNILDENLSVLKYKKQIILQGPPGTGKTRLAKQLAQALISPLDTITDSDITLYVPPGSLIQSTGGQKAYIVESIDVPKRKITVKRESETSAEISYDLIQKAFRERLWEQSVDQNMPRITASLARHINEKSQNIEKREEFKLLQFHPSYSYEDFVRGIVAKPNIEGDGIVYEAEDKALAQLAKAALANFRNALAPDLASKESIQVKTNLELFIDYVQNKMADNKENKYDLTDSVYIFESDDKGFRYKGDNWKAHSKGLNMKYTEIEKILTANVRERADIQNLHGLNSLTQSHATYYARILEKYDDFVQQQPSKEVTIPAREPLKNYVLIIDEINRANLSSVLGELIYALEYRGEKVESIYAVDDSTGLILPPNLYIIGTMNTADRSVGHIDYAVRRRFAFLNVLPQDLSDDLKDRFHKNLFLEISALFNHETNLSREFAPQDVQLGHSYFILQYEKDREGKDLVDKLQPFSFRLEYEIKPILLEYVKDGILIGERNGMRIEDYIHALSV